ncbi:CAP domain-containing protein [Rhodococcus sp. ARC_M13]|uniref:CAP domain-containing protein n=1 Tax=Rhodococcus sp. ARC_M13 TaxID=2928855 RepID=UPI001FB3B3C9|nr:CAP domain-containing protein [Rhodococcus sp. ARC_M13]MCJ0895972.1 CAP domain-containing protein [Rhodococcus sp. ARC_M13]
MTARQFQLNPIEHVMLVLVFCGVILSAILCMAGILAIDKTEPSLAEPAAISTAAITPNILEALVNTERTKAGKQPLVTDSALRASSCAKADHILSQDYWAHTSPDGVTPWTFIEKAGYRYTTAGENLAKSYPDEASLVAAWMNSPSHRENVLGDFNDQGICQKTGTLQGKMTTVTVQHVGVRSR